MIEKQNIDEKKSEENKQTITDLSSAHRHSQAKFQLIQTRAPFLERPGNLTGPKSYFEFKV